MEVAGSGQKVVEVDGSRGRKWDKTKVYGCR